MQVAIRVLEGLFFLGVLFSLIVIAITFVEDFRLFVEPKELMNPNKRMAEIPKREPRKHKTRAG